jgi:hypothetical protein
MEKLLSCLTAVRMVSIAGCSNTESETTNAEEEEDNKLEEEHESEEKQDDPPPKPPDGIGTADNAIQNESSGD